MSTEALTKAQELWPCPRCRQTEASLYANNGVYAVECDNCDCRTPLLSSVEAARSEWNRRAALATKENSNAE